MKISLRDNNFELLPQRAVYWKEHDSLILSDLHLGKSMHFRKEGIPIPKTVFDADLQNLNNLIVQYKPAQLIVVGDMFHSRRNNEIVLFHLWRLQYPQLKIVLVKGNHDILSDADYEELEIDCISDYETSEFIFTHDECDVKSDKFCFSGHIHPGIRLEGLARQSIRFPCFYFSVNSCVLPAFGQFTGLAKVKYKKGDRAYAIVSQQIIPITEFAI